ncbi:ATP-grasp domain-containing protein [Miniphocaeibacter halophilus]|uniref:ATP-grasp domain-containing protein n=1 Tax=Miniphocaeibacter halophilus TaxID=2931922 RepID=A0AC61MRR2_9FIRM|nr:ATP-grasp domain-containing protein [Miniphocaeibacter halophilus]QQK08274.1 ATP-grasp domain-containing protein [Miniphocaeibacter halophilus]
MFILDPPYISEELKEYLVQSQLPVLENNTSVNIFKNQKINLVNKNEFLDILSKNNRFYTCSENSLDWVIKNINDKNLNKYIELMKNKFLFRKTIEDEYPNFFYKEADLNKLSQINTNNLKYPFILKPKVGFFSVGVYLISNSKDWNNAIKDIMEKSKEWEKTYPKSVVNTEFILEQYIYGEEFAIDAYFDENGKTVILNILKHDFDGISDVSDRLYFTGKSIMEKYLTDFTNWLNKINGYLNIKNFPFHAEIRINEGKITPIEFNPLRFAGWSCTDISYYAFGFHTFDYYLNKKTPNWNEVLKDKDNSYYTIIVMDKSGKVNPKDIFDYEKASKDLGTILTLRKIDFYNNPIFGFIFSKINKDDKNTMKEIIRRDFNEYLKKA